MVELTLRDGRKTTIRASFVVKVVSEVVGGQDCTRLEILGAPYSTYVVEPYEEVRMKVIRAINRDSYAKLP